MLDVREVTVSFDRAPGSPPLLDRVSLHVDRAEVLALLGPSGSGKSTLLRVIAGLQSVESGQVFLEGKDITDVPTHRRSVGMVFQDNQLFPHRNVADNIAFGLRMRRVQRRERDARVDELLALVGLTGFGERSVGRLSGGEAKRVALARALAPTPAVLLLDEPLTGLDRALHTELAGELAGALRATGTTAVLVTHDHDEAALIADRTVHLGDLGAAP